MKALLPAAVAAALLLGCVGSGPTPAPEDAGDDTIVLFAPVGQRLFLTETDAGALDNALRSLIESSGHDEATRSYANRWVQPPGWQTTVEAFGEPEDGDLFVRQGYPYRTNLVDPQSGVVVLAYTKQAPPSEFWQPRRGVHVSGRLEGYARRPPGVVILLDAEFEAPPATDADGSGSRQRS